MQQHIIDYLLDEYKKHRADDLPVAVVNFGDFCKEHLAENPPTSVSPVMSGLGLTLRDLTIVLFSDQPLPSGLNHESYPITKPATGRESTADPFVVPVTGKR